MITASGLSLALGGKPILQDISLRLINGDITAILGPNGAGKSTLLKCLTGFLKPDRGHIHMDNKVLADYSLDALARKRAVLSQANPINFPFTTLEIVMMGRNPYADNRSANADSEIARHALQSVDALHLEKRIFPTLSGGEQQRVQLARVLAQLWQQENAYLFLDEPIAALDLKHQHKVFDISRALTKKGFAIYMIIHDLNLAMRYAQQVILLKDGQLFAAGKAKDVLNAENIEKVFEIKPELVFGNFSHERKNAGP